MIYVILNNLLKFNLKSSTKKTKVIYSIIGAKNINIMFLVWLLFEFLLFISFVVEFVVFVESLSEIRGNPTIYGIKKPTIVM